MTVSLDEPIQTTVGRSLSGTVLLHIGPAKTGTSAIQGSLHAARDRLGAYGVYLPAANRHPMNAFIAAAGHQPLQGTYDEHYAKWRRMAGKASAAVDRVSALSSEFLGDADDEHIQRIIDDLGGERVRVAVTVRPIASLLASQWQQYVQNGLRAPYEVWLDRMLRRAPYVEPTPSFWQRHRYDRLVERWARVVGPERVSVVVVDKDRRGGLLRDFETLLGVPPGLLQEVTETENRSLTRGEVEAVRRFYEIAKARPDYAQLNIGALRFRALPALKRDRRPRLDEDRVVTPGWALDAAAETGLEIGSRISSLGVRLLGDPTLLGQRPEDQPLPIGVPELDPEAAATLMLHLVAPYRDVAADEPAVAGTVAQTRTMDLLRTIVWRLKRRLFRF